jgi:hypothetical protein
LARVAVVAFVSLVAGIFAVPKVVSALGQFGWNPNWGYWRPIGNYSIGSELTPLRSYRGSLGGELTPLVFYRGGMRQLGQAYRSGENLLPFGFPDEYGTPDWEFAPPKRDIM